MLIKFISTQFLCSSWGSPMVTWLCQTCSNRVILKFLDSWWLGKWLTHGVTSKESKRHFRTLSSFQHFKRSFQHRCQQDYYLSRRWKWLNSVEWFLIEFSGQRQQLKQKVGTHIQNHMGLGQNCHTQKRDGFTTFHPKKKCGKSTMNVDHSPSRKPWIFHIYVSLP